MGEANRREELIIYNFEEGWEAEVVKGENFLSGLYAAVRSGRIFLPWIKICAWTDR